ncbi:Calmodulin-lysine N-methyltransferase, partial [Stegodyphus mimosarum]
MTQALMNDWFENHFIPEACQHLNSVGLPDDSKIGLTADNCSAHTSLKVLAKGNVSVLFFHPNCTSIIQPMDMGILHALKCKYKVVFLKSVLNFLNNGKTIQEFLKYFSIKSAVWSIARSWEDVSPDTLKNAWHNLWPATIFHGEDDEDDSREFEGFWTLQTKGKIFQLLDYVKKCGEAVINEDSITEVFHCDDNTPIINQLMHGKICSMVLDPENTTSDSEESDRKVIENEKISIDKLLRWDMDEDLTDCRTRFDVVLCADCLYYDEGRQPLSSTIWKILKDNGLAVILAPTRGRTFQQFVDLVQKRFHVERLMAYDTHVWELNCRLKESKSSIYDEDLHYPQMLILRKI